MFIENNLGASAAYTYSSRKVTGSGTDNTETLEEYQSRIQEAINKIPFHPSHRKITETLVISEEGYQAMKDDPEYEKWVLANIKENRSVDLSMMTSRKDYLRGTDYEYFGATKEEYRGQGDNQWDYSKSSSGSSAKKNKKTGILNSSTDNTELWEQIRYQRACAREERNEEYFSHKLELEQRNRERAEESYTKNFIFDSE